MRLNITPLTAPPNDNFANSVDLGSAASLSVRGTNAGSTRENAEPVFGAGATSWVKWTAPYSGEFFVTTAGSDFTPTISVYTGNSVNALAVVARMEHGAVAGDSTARVRFAATAGTIYRIAVDGSAHLGFGFIANGNYTLTILPVPALTAYGLTGSGNARNFRLTWRSEPYQTYRIQKSSDLTNWTSAGSCFPTTGTTGTLDIPVPAATTPRMYFRVSRE